MRRVTRSRPATSAAAATGSSMAALKSALNGRVMSSVPPKPTAIAIQRSAPTRSPSTGPARRAMKIGEENPSDEATASGSSTRPERKQVVAATSKAPRARVQRSTSCRLMIGRPDSFSATTNTAITSRPRNSSIWGTVSVAPACLMTASLSDSMTMAASMMPAALKLCVMPLALVRSRERSGQEKAGLMRPASDLAPHLPGHVDHEGELAPLLLLGQQVAFLGGGEAALRAQAELLHRREGAGLLDAREHLVALFQLAELRRHEAQHHALVALRQEPERLEAAGAIAVVLEEVAVVVELAKQDFGHRLVASLR